MQLLDCVGGWMKQLISRRSSTSICHIQGLDKIMDIHLNTDHFLLQLGYTTRRVKENHPFPWNPGSWTLRLLLTWGSYTWDHKWSWLMSGLCNARSSVQAWGDLWLKHRMCVRNTVIISNSSGNHWRFILYASYHKVYMQWSSLICLAGVEWGGGGRQWVTGSPNSFCSIASYN